MCNIFSLKKQTNNLFFIFYSSRQKNPNKFVRTFLGKNAADISTELNLIDQQVLRIDAIVGKLLQFARPSEFGTFEETSTLGQIVKDSLVLVNHVILKDGIEIVCDITECPDVKISSGELQQVVASQAREI